MQLMPTKTIPNTFLRAVLAWFVVTRDNFNFGAEPPLGVALQVYHAYMCEFICVDKLMAARTVPTP